MTVNISKDPLKLLKAGRERRNEAGALIQHPSGAGGKKGQISQ